MISSILHFDEVVLLEMNSIIGRFAWLDKIIDILAVYLIYSIPIILLSVWFYSRYTKKAALQLTFSAFLPWLLFNKLFPAFIWYRPRPYTANIGVKELVFHRPDYSFPSDHATVLMALTLAAWLMGYKKLGWALFTITIIISCSRVVIGVHYPLDIIGGWVAGTVGALIIYWLREPLTKYVYNPIIKIATKIKLA